MEKLLKLLNEFDSGWDYDDYYGPYQYGQDRDAYIYGKYYLVSRDYGFIKWLVENDKIDRDKKEIEKSDYDVTFTGALTKDKKSDLDIMVDTLLMLLSISDTPIENLLLYLK